MISLGCPKNLVDSEVMLGQLTTAGFTVCQEADEADVLLVNTCGFIRSAVEEGIDSIMEMIRIKQSTSHTLLVVTGCMVQRYGEELRRELPEVDLFIGTETIRHIAAQIDRLLSTATPASGRSKIPVSDGQHHAPPSFNPGSPGLPEGHRRL